MSTHSTKKLSKTQESSDILNDTYERVRRVIAALNADQAQCRDLTNLLDRIEEDMKDVERRAQEERIRIGILGGRGSGKSTLV
jgi:hypothetical protein